MSREQVKGTLLTVGATAASTALLVGGFVGYNHMQRATASVDVVDTFNQMEAKKVAAEDVQHGVFSDHCLVATLIGETDLDFTAPGTQTATIGKPASLNGGYVTWV